MTRIFLLTRDHQSLVRGITNPSLPSFITMCLRLSGDSNSSDTRLSAPRDSILSTILWAFGELLLHFPITFRPFVAQIRALVLPLIAPASTLPLDEFSSEGTKATCSEILALRARQVLVLLSGCAPKNTQSQEWAQSLYMSIAKSHGTADLVFRALHEDWEYSFHDNSSRGAATSSLPRTVQSNEEESDLPGWVGIRGGLERLNGLLLTVHSHLAHPSPFAVAIPTGKVLDLVDRILSALAPSVAVSNGVNIGTRTKPEISRDECETLWTWLPQLHVSALNILEHFVARLEQDSMSIDQRLLGDLLWIFQHEGSHVRIRQVVYRVLAQMLTRCASGVHGSVASSLASVLRTCCEDLVPTEAYPNHHQMATGNSKLASSMNATNADAYLKRTSSPVTSLATPNETRRVAETLLVSGLVHLASDFLPFSVRSKIDRTAVLAQSKPILQASILNPPYGRKGNQQASVMPLLARQFPQSQDTEALLRPRMPLIQPTAADQNSSSESEVNERQEIDDEIARRSRSEDPSVSSEPDKQAAFDLTNTKTRDDAHETQPSILSFPDEGKQVTNLTVPAKRAFDLETEELASTATDPGEQPSRLDVEPPSKRMRSDTGKTDVPSAKEPEFPVLAASSQIEPFNPLVMEEPDNTGALASMGNMKENKDDDDSDDSSIPAIDPTMDTDNEEDEE